MHGQGLGIWKEPGLQSLLESSRLPEKRTPHTGILNNSLKNTGSQPLTPELCQRLVGPP